MYTARIAVLENVQPIDGADRIKTASASGWEVIVGADHHDGNIGVVFPEGGEISPSLGMHAGLFRKHPITGESLGGYLDLNGRVCTVKLRGEASRALWVPLSAFDGLDRWHLDGCDEPFDNEWVSENDVEDLRACAVGTVVDALRGVPLCRKFLSKATRRFQNKRSGRTVTPEERALPEHYDTGHLRDSIRKLPKGMWVVTLKMHGTSGRTGRPLVDFDQVGEDGEVTHVSEHRWVSGTRRTQVTEDHYDSYRWYAHKVISSFPLDDGEVWYYEIVGYSTALDDAGFKPIAGFHKPDSLATPVKKLFKKLTGGGKRMVYSYGCVPSASAIYVYRIVRDGRELTYNEIVDRIFGLRCETMVNVVPLLHAGPGPMTLEQLDTMTRWCDHELEKDHFREGVVVRVEYGGEVVSPALKHKGFAFCQAEGNRTNDDTYVDEEDIA